MKVLSIRDFPADLLKDLKRLALERETSLRAEVIRILQEAVDKK